MHNAEKLRVSAVICIVGPVIAACLATIFMSRSAAAAELVVDAENGPYFLISSAINDAKEGDLITVMKGTYAENVLIDKGLTIVGKDRPAISGCYDKDSVCIQADGVHVEGFVIKGSGLDMMYGYAGVKVLGNSSVVKNNILEDNLFGIYLKNCDGAIIIGNDITGRRDKGLGERGSGIAVYASNYNSISGNKVRTVRDGIYFDHADFNIVKDNEFSDLRYGVHYMYCDDNAFVGNIFKDSAGGVAIMYTERVTFSENLIINNRSGFNAFGLLYKDARDCLAEGNIIVNGVSGIFVEGSHNNIFRKNLVAYNDVAVILYASSMGNEFSENDFIGNLSDLKTVGRAKADWSPGGKGNYYSAYSGYDLDGDGIGDVTHSIQSAFEHLEGGNPLLRLYLSSGAADAMILAEKTFPIISAAREEDKKPFLKPVSQLKLTAHGAGNEGGSIASAFFVLTLLFFALSAGWRLTR